MTIPPLSYAAIIAIVLVSVVVAGALVHPARRLMQFEALRRHHEVGSAVFLQLGVVFAVLLAFVFSEVWKEYNTAGEAINQECAGLHAAVMLAAALPLPMAEAVNQGVTDYIHVVINDEWPDMARRRISQKASVRMEQLVRTVGLFQSDDVRVATTQGQLLSVLAQAHQSRETRLFQMVQHVPGLVWVLLISFSVLLIGFLYCFGVESVWSQIGFTGTFAGALAFALLLVHLLDYPFEGVLRIPPTDFYKTLHAVSSMGTHAPPDH